MRPLYLFLRITLPYLTSIFYRRTKAINGQRKFNAQTIFVSNHPSAFIDPLNAGNFQMPILYFVTRGDIFTWWLKPVTWASHMVPIFRKALDGADSHEKNKDSFVYLRKTLLRKKSLILFGEGLTDDVFIRRLKVIKKGPARIGFDTMVETNWEVDIKMQALGLNYTHPKHFRSDLLVSNGEIIHLKDYKSLYEENPNAAITKLTRAIQKSLQEQITHVERIDLAPFVEEILILSRKGMNHQHYDKQRKLIDRFRFSQRVANKINQDFKDEDHEWSDLKTQTNDYFKALEKEKINEDWVHQFSQSGKKNIVNKFLLFFLLLPITILGLVHQLIPYIIIKRFVEKTFRRPVFWSGVKLLLGATLSFIYNFAFIFLFYAYVYPSYWLAVLYFISVPVVSGVIAYNQIKSLNDTLKYRKISTETMQKFVQLRSACIASLKKKELL